MKEELLFSFIKDRVLLSSKELDIKYNYKKEYLDDKKNYILVKVNDFDVKNLRIRILNYQIEKYGTQLDRNVIEFVDNDKASKNSKQRHYERCRQR